MKKFGNSTKAAVIITVLNEEASIAQTLQALRAQTVAPSEVIIVDGGSKDSTWKVLSNYQKQYSDFPLQTFKKIGNRSVGRNYAIGKSKSSLIAITDVGCVPEPDWLEKLLAKHKETGAPVVAGYYKGSPETDFEEAVVPYALVMPDRIDPESFLPATRSMLLKKKVWDSAGGFNEHLSDNEDYVFAKQLERQGTKIAFARDAVVAWRPRSNLMSFYKMIYRFAKGDMYAAIIRPKVLLIYLRYLVGLGLVWLAIAEPLLLPFTLITFLTYAAWAVAKNAGYAPNGWQYLPVLQVVSDIAVMHGSVVGIFQRLLKRN